MIDSIFHKIDLSKFSFLVTGGAGFIGSNIVEYLVNHQAGHIRILDNLSTGAVSNIKAYIDLPNVEVILGDIRDLDVCKKALENIDFVSHQAALGSVPRSLADPITFNEVNINGFLNMLVAAKDSSVLKRFVYAASSSTYGDSAILPKVEGVEGKPISPYAVTKAVNELYADVFSKSYGFHTIGLRYFNVFGPRQSPNNAYAAVIPVFCKHFLEFTSPTINGDGETSRDFIYVQNVVQANMRALLFDTEDETKKLSNHEIFNVACGEQVSLNQVVKTLKTISGLEIEPSYDPERAGDIKHSLASIAKASEVLDYYPLVKFKEGLKLTYQYIEMNAEIYSR
ncbi:MAG: GDP-mannose 4,6-dehydratase [Algoriphagus sp.]|uniref:NAD-dependent epimerase/dehydratase family protein n=1 Tax=Algoriphagus sp. TaxID=1872435 RepID=UPI002637F80B|nr:NAD-dependent epimerase/dehydratase family protein [Algoriphagus sp.]MDG1278223.1 GDP-mannose 4,6-dehydratase [Algoriphagus sp.]